MVLDFAVVLNLIPQHDPHPDSQLAVINHFLLIASKGNHNGEAA
jgi:hypothetical protein